MPTKKNLHPTRVYDRLKQDIEEAIENEVLRSGDRVKSIQALSEEYGISVNSTRQAIHELAADGKLDIRGVSGTYVSASALSGEPEALDPVLMVFGRDPDRKDDSGQFKLGVLEGLSRAGVRHDVFFCPDAAAPVDQFKRLRVHLSEHPTSGIIMRRHTPFFLREMADMPIVFANNYRPPGFLERTARIEFSLDEMVYLGTEMMIARGHRRIGLITQSPGAYMASPVVGYRAAMDSAGLAHDPAWVTMPLSWHDRDGMNEAIDSFLRAHEELTALCITDDYGCAILLDRLHEISPQREREIDIVSWANLGSSRLWRRQVCQIEVDHVQWGREAAELLLGLTSGEIEPGTCRAFTPKLITI